MCRPVEPADLNAFTTFVETRAFADNPKWAGCYCVFPYVTESRAAWFDPKTKAANKATLTGLVNGGRGHWLLARLEGTLVGWVNADLLSRMPYDVEWGARLPGETGVINCFVVDPQYRRAGIATELLSAAVIALLTMGANQVESWAPRDPAARAKPPLGADQMAHRARFRCT